MSSFDLRLLDGDDSATVRALLPGFRATMAEALPLDPPASEPLLTRLLQRRHGTDRIVVAAFDAAVNRDRPVGYAKLGLDLSAVSDAGHGSLWVFPAHRCCGAGRALLESCRSELRDRGRARLLVDAPRSPAALSFVDRLGGTAKATTLRTRITRDGSPVPLAGLGDRSGPAAYRTLRWNERCPDDLLDAFAAAREHLGGPVNGQSAVGQDTARAVRAREDEAIRAEHRQYAVAAVVDRRVVGYSTMFVRAAPMADAAETVVLPTHRRCGLGVGLKAELLGWAFRDNPGLQLVQAWNDEGNTPIVGLNRKLGHTVDSAWTTWEFPA